MGGARYVTSGVRAEGYGEMKRLREIRAKEQWGNNGEGEGGLGERESCVARSEQNIKLFTH